MEITAIAPWYGAKRRLADQIVYWLGWHSMYIEPFCGSLAVLLNKPRSSIEIVNDLHVDLINLALVIQSDKCEQLYDRLERTLNCEELYQICRAEN